MESLAGGCSGAGTFGVQPVATAREAFSGDAVFSMLADDAAVREVIGPLLDGAPQGLIHVNMATISVSLARELALDLRLALAAAEDSSVPMPLADVVHASLLEAAAHGDGDRDLSALAMVSMRRAGAQATAKLQTDGAI